LVASGALVGCAGAAVGCAAGAGVAVGAGAQAVNTMLAITNMLKTNQIALLRFIASPPKERYFCETHWQIRTDSHSLVQASPP
jgi:hypothetical protein